VRHEVKGVIPVENERDVKLDRLRRLMADAHVDAIWLRRLGSVAWLTAGAASYVSIADEHGIASLVVTPRVVHLFTNNIEAPRLMAEEELSVDAYEWHINPWHTPASPLAILPDDHSIGCDEAYPGTVDLGRQIASLRSQLTPGETTRMRDVGRRCADAMRATVHRIEPGMSELQIAGILSAESIGRGVTPIVNLVATDERVYQFRHPIPTSRRLERYAMVVLSGRRYGMIASLTRLVHFGQIDAELADRALAVMRVDATLIARTRPGADLKDIFQAGADVYRAAGYPDEWLHHHQGGVSGYEGREEKGTPTATGTVRVGQAYAWNPSIAGVKSEDTILVGADDNEIITGTPDLPTIMVDIDGKLIPRPAIWERA
jgi:Xaa-Pro aminopeptidase